MGTQGARASTEEEDEPSGWVWSWWSLRLTLQSPGKEESSAQPGPGRDNATLGLRAPGILEVFVLCVAIPWGS